MARPKKYTFETDIYDGFGVPQIKDSIIRCLNEISSLKTELKAFSSATNDTIKELQARVDAALLALLERDAKKEDEVSDIKAVG